MGRPKKLVATEEVVDVQVENVNVEDTVETIENVAEVEETPEVVETVEVTPEVVETEKETLEVVETEKETPETPSVIVDDVDPTVTYGVAEGRDESEYVYEEPTITVHSEPEGIKVKSLSDLRHNNPRTNVIKASRAYDGAAGVRVSTKVAKLF